MEDLLNALNNHDDDVLQDLLWGHLDGDEEDEAAVTALL